VPNKVQRTIVCTNGSSGLGARVVHTGMEETMPDPVPKPPGRPPGEPIIIKDPSRPPDTPEIDRCPDEEDDPEIKKPPDIVPEMPPPPGPEERAVWPLNGCVPPRSAALSLPIR
jgi:hypothetical protein